MLKLTEFFRTSSAITSDDNDRSARQQRRQQRAELSKRNRGSHQQRLQHKWNSRHSAFERSQREHNETKKSWWSWWVKVYSGVGGTTTARKAHAFPEHVRTMENIKVSSAEMFAASFFDPAFRTFTQRSRSRLLRTAILLFCCNRFRFQLSGECACRTQENEALRFFVLFRSPFFSLARSMQKWNCAIISSDKQRLLTVFPIQLRFGGCAIVQFPFKNGQRDCAFVYDCTMPDVREMVTCVWRGNDNIY